MAPLDPSLEEYLDGWRIRQLKRMRSSSTLSSRAHSKFLESRRSSLKELADLTKDELEALGGAQSTVNTNLVVKPVLFDTRLLEEFGRGSIVACLGDAFAVYAGRRSPRIPNGDLRMMSRVTTIEGEKRNFDRPARIVTEFDVPENAWFLRPVRFSFVPNFALMEMALQPCGFLSAYLETSLTRPEQEFYFRNLDGQARLVFSPDLRGKTVTARARLLKSTTSSDIIIQQYAFELLVGNALFYEGNSTFGYFPPSAMASQAGLDGGKSMMPWIDAQRKVAYPVQLLHASSSVSRVNQDHKDRRLDDLDQLVFIPGGGRYQQGYLFGSKVVHPEDWYFRYHFFEDPVMPGSLGIEAALSAMRTYAAQAFASQFNSMRFGVAEYEPATWKYRGQILQNNRQMDLEVHFKKSEAQPGKLTLWGDASLWSDQTRIYEMSQIGVKLTDG
ncbi:MAG TPA: hypothetical protein VMT46_19335 [Anaerolineaceae bacterium]|nr:hypothetical protein [Anaerolineaceae bacterium]